MKDVILKIIRSSENSLTVEQLKKELQHHAILETYGISSFKISDMRKALQELIEEGKVEQEKIETTISVYKDKNGE